MKITCGTDIIEIDRVKESIEELGEKFIKRVFTDKEIEYCESRKGQKYQHYAGRFAAKEAAFKAISKILDNKYLYNVNTKDIESIDISISHCKLYATANVVILFNDYN